MSTRRGMTFTVEVTLQTRRPLTQKQLFDVAEVGGVAVGRPGGRTLETILTVNAVDARDATEQGVDTVVKRVVGTAVAVNVMTTSEADRRLAQNPRSSGHQNF